MWRTAGTADELDGEGELKANHRGGHEGQDEDRQSEQRAELATGIERRGVVDGRSTKEANTEEEPSPNVPTRPLPEIAESNQSGRKKPRRNAMKARAHGTKNVAAVELCGGEQVERGGKESDPGGTSDGREKEHLGINAWVKKSIEPAQKQGSAEEDVGLRRIGVSESRNDTGVKHAIEQRGDGKDKTDERAGSADVEESAIGADGRTHKNERAEGADERWEGNEEGIAGMDAMTAAREEMAEFVGKKNREQRGGKGQAGEKAGRIFIEELESAEEFVKGSGLIFCVGCGELRSGDETGAKRQKKQHDSQNERPGGRARRDDGVKVCRRGKRAPVNLRRKRVEG